MLFSAAAQVFLDQTDIRATAMKFLKALPFLSSLFMLPAVSPAEYVFTSFTETSERDMYIWGSSNATSWDLIKGPAYVRLPLAPSRSISFFSGLTASRLPQQDSCETLV